MRFYKVILIVSAAFALFACSEPPKPSTPFETLKSYTLAIKKKDTTAMKLLLSDATMKMNERQARDQGVTVDDVVKNETLFTESQNRLEYRNEKIEGDRATIEVKNSVGNWDTVPFVLEQGIWKIDKQALVEQKIEENQVDQQELERRLNDGRIP